MSKKKLIFSLVVTSFSIVFCGTVNFANASSVVEVCRLDAKIINVTEEHVFVDITGIKIYNKSSVLCADINKNSDYKIIRDNFLKNAYRESIFVGQDIVIDGVSGNAMGPDGAVFWDSWELESAGGKAIKLPITLEKTTSFVADNMYALSEIINRSGQPNEVIIYTEGYITGVSKCTEYEIKNQIVGCGPEGMLAVSQDISGKGIGVNVIQDYQNPVDVNNVKIGGKYKISIKTGGLSGSSLKLVSLKLLDANVTNNSLVEGRTYTVAKLNKNTSITPRKFFTEAYVYYRDCTGLKCSSNLSLSDTLPLTASTNATVKTNCQENSTLQTLDVCYRDIVKKFNLIDGKRYRFEISVHNTSKTNIPQNEFTLVSVKNIDGSTVVSETTTPLIADQSAKRSFFGRIWNWFAGLFNR